MRKTQKKERGPRIPGIMPLAREWRMLLDESKDGDLAVFARKLGVGPARLERVLSVLEAPPEILAAIEMAEASGYTITERIWRGLRGLPTEEVLEQLEGMRGDVKG